jgi:hypothetical protein
MQNGKSKRHKYFGDEMKTFEDSLKGKTTPDSQT